MSQSRAEALQDLEREVGVLVRRIKRVIAERAACVHPELQPGAFQLLLWVADHGPVRPSVLVDEFHIDKGAVSRTMQHLVDLGLLDREPDPEDGRATLISASPDAVRRLKDAAAQRRAWVRERLEGWSAAELSELAEHLGRYNQALM